MPKGIGRGTEKKKKAPLRTKDEKRAAKRAKQGR